MFNSGNAREKSELSICSPGLEPNNKIRRTAAPEDVNSHTETGEQLWLEQMRKYSIRVDLQFVLNP